MRNAIILISVMLLLFAGCAQQGTGNGVPATGSGQEGAPASSIQPPSGTGSGQPASGAGNGTLETGGDQPDQEMGQWNVSTERNETVDADGNNATEKEYSGIRFGDYTLLLEDLAPLGGEYCALVRVVGIEGEGIIEYERAQVCPGESYYWVSPEGHQYRIYVVDTAAGYSQGKIWANIIIYG